MKEYNVLKAYRDEDEGVIIHEVPELGKDYKKIKYAGVIGGISWATESSPPYFYIVGNLWDGEYRRPGQKNKKGNLVLLDEQKSDSLSLDEFNNKATDSANRCYCEQLFADLSEGFGGYVESFQKYVNSNEITNPRPFLSEAPYGDNFLYGVKLVKDWEREKKIEIPEDTTVYKQLKTIGQEHLKDKPEVHFYAINALRYVMGSFFKTDYRPFIRQRRRPRGTWMSA